MREILKQSSWLILAQVLTRAIGFFYTIFLAKILGVSDFGLLTVALAYFSIVSSISDFGFNRFLVRELAKDKLRASELLCTVVILRITLSTVLFAVFAILLYFFDPDKTRVSLILLAVLAILPQAVALTFDSIFVVTQRLHFSAIALVLSSLLTALSGLFLVGGGFGVFGAVNALIFGQLIYVITILVLLFKYSNILLTGIKLSLIKKALVESLPYGLLGVLGLLYFRIDTVILSYIKGNFETGIYSAAYRFLEAVVFIPTSFSTVLFPILAKLHDADLARIKVIYFKSLKVMLSIAILIALSYVIILPVIFRIYLKEYLPAIELIKILSLAIPFMFMHVASSTVVLSTEKYLKQIILISCIPLTFNVVSNILFIPIYGYLAASWITVASDILSFILIFLFIRNNIFKHA